MFFFFFSSRRRHTRFKCDWSSDVCSSDLSAMELHLRGCDAALFAELDRPIAMAAAGTVSEAGCDAAGSFGRHSELLSSEAASRRRRSDQWQHQDAGKTRARLQEPTLSTAQSPAYGCHQDRIRRLQEGRLNWASCQIPAQSPIMYRRECDNRHLTGGGHRDAYCIPRRYGVVR